MTRKSQSTSKVIRRYSTVSDHDYPIRLAASLPHSNRYRLHSGLCGIFHSGTRYRLTTRRHPLSTNPYLSRGKANSGSNSTCKVEDRAQWLLTSCPKGGPCTQGVLKEEVDAVCSILSNDVGVCGRFDMGRRRMRSTTNRGCTIAIG